MLKWWKYTALCWFVGHDIESEVGSPFCWRCGKKVQKR
jgi:hypothetical protein